MEPGDERLKITRKYERYDKADIFTSAENRA